mgnify:CR=1 FL=1
MIRRRASRYFLPGMEAEDVVQEGLIGLLKAIRLYDRDQSSFPVFASLCACTALVMFRSCCAPVSVWLNLL